MLNLAGNSKLIKLNKAANKHVRRDLDQKEGREQTYKWIGKGLVKQQLVCTKENYLSILLDRENTASLIDVSSGSKKTPCF